MSADLGIFKSIGEDNNEGDLLITAFSGGTYGASIQFGIQTIQGYHFCRLSETQLERLTEIIQKRLNYERNFTATGNDRNEIIKPKRIKTK
jgi:hypothetical protein